MRYFIVNRRPDTHEYEDDRRYDDEPYYDDYEPEYGHTHYREERPYYSDYKARYRDEYDEYEDYGHEPKRRSRMRRKTFVLPNEEAANMIMQASSFGEYIMKHGYHFTGALADCATSKMINSDGRKHNWTTDQIRQQLVMHGITDTGNCTLGDIAYLANMAYADLFPNVLNSEHACIKYAIAVAKDPDGYDGMAFSRWIADLIGKRVVDIEWEKYV